MNLKSWSISYGIVTRESAENGAYSAEGWHARNLSFRESIEALRQYVGGYCEADSCPVSRDFPPRWFIWPEAEKCDAAGAVTSYSLHIPPHITTSSRMRLAQLLSCYGAA